MENEPHAAAVAAKLRRLGEAGTRIVLCGRPPAPETAAIALTFDNRGGGRELTEHLIGLGHRRLGYIAGPEERTTTRHRLEGHRAALAAAGIEEDPAGPCTDGTTDGPATRRRWNCCAGIPP